MDSDAANKALDADQALQELGSDLVGQAYVTATITVWDACVFRAIPATDSDANRPVIPTQASR